MNLPSNMNMSNKASIHKWLVKHLEAPLNCNVAKHLYHRSTANGHVGFTLANVNRSSSNKLNLVNIAPTSVRRGMAKLDVGRQGAVFLASLDKSAAPESLFVIKVCPFDLTRKGKRQAAEAEYEIQEKLYAVAPAHIPKPMGFFQCQDFVDSKAIWTPEVREAGYDYRHQSVMFSEYMQNGTLNTYLRKVARRMTDAVIKSIIKQILTTLDKIYKRYPEFLHFDLHMSNILVKPGPVVVLNDFGLSRLTKANAVNTYDRSFGIGVNSDARYDTHLFLSEMLSWLDVNSARTKDGCPKSLAFLRKAVPTGYRGKNNASTMQFRLKYGMNHAAFPTLAKILADPYITGVSATLPKLEPMRPPVLMPRKEYTNAQLLAMLPKNQKNLKPNQLARVIALKKAGGATGPVKPKPKVLTFGQPKPKPMLVIAKAKPRSPSVLRGAKFNRLAGNLMNFAGNKTHEERWSAAKRRAESLIKKRLRNGNAPFAPTPPKAKVAKVNSPKPKVSPPKGKKTPRDLLEMSRSPRGRIKMKGASGKPVYAEGSTLSMADLQDFAKIFKIDTTGMRSKAEIAQALFSKV